MARAFHLITLAPNLAESRIVGTGVRAHAPALQVEREGASEGLPFPVPAVERLLEAHGASRLPLAVVLPSKSVTFRRVDFPFDRPRQVAQALDFELENELLGGLEQYAYTHRQFKGPDGGATVLVYLIERVVLDTLNEIFERHEVSPMRITFSASALYLSTPLMSPNHFQVYAGAEETFISMIRGNRLHSVRTFPFDPIVPILTATERRIVKARDFMTLLERRKARPERQGPPPGAPGEDAPGQAAPEQAAQGQPTPEQASSAQAAQDQPAQGQSPQGQGPPGGVERRRRRSGSEHELFLNRFRSEFEGLLPDINQFIRLHAYGEPVTLSLHGMFAPFVEFDAERSEVRMRDNPPTEPSTPRDSLGIIEELSGHPEEFRSSALIQFAARHDGWRERLAELRRPLIAAGVAALVLVGLLTANFFLRLGMLEQQMARAESRIAETLEDRVPPGTSSANGVAILRERLGELQGEVDKRERFTARRYDVLDMLKEVSAVVSAHPGLTVESLSYDADRFTITGVTPSYNVAESLRADLAELERFAGGEATITNQNTRQGITYRISIER